MMGRHGTDRLLKSLQSTWSHCYNQLVVLSSALALVQAPSGGLLESQSLAQIISLRSASLSFRSKQVLGFVVLILLASLLAAPASAREDVNWDRLPPGCQQRLPDADILPCGQLGYYIFYASPLRRPASVDEPTTAGLCNPLASGSENPPDISRVNPSDSVGGNLWSPCQGGSCFTPNNNFFDRDWVAIIDWGDPHGWHVGQTLKHGLGQADVDLALFRVNQSDVPLVDDLDEVGDAHLMERLCNIADLAAIRPPLAVNMSFGRLNGPDCTGPSSIGCQIELVMNHLKHDLGVALVAAAGNHGEIQFPASSDNVFSAGALDLGELSGSGRAVPTPLTPSETEVLVPGYGLILENQDGDVFAVPPGTSYASSLATAWIARMRLAGVPLSALDQVTPESPLRLERSMSGYHGVVGDTGLVFDTPEGLDRLLDVAIGKRPEPFSSLLDVGFLHEVSLVAVPDPPDVPSLSEINSDNSRPSPDSEPCVPCHLRKWKKRNRFRGVAEGPATLPQLSLEGAGGIGSEAELVDVFLKVGEQYYRLETASYDTLIYDLQDGLASVLQFQELPDEVGSEFVSVEYRLRRYADDVVFWDSTPVTIHRYEEPMFADDFESGDVSFWPSGLTF